MARTALATQPIADEGTVVTMTAANVDGHILDGGGDVILKVTNGSGGSINVTVQTPATQAGLAVSEQIVAVAAGATKYIGRFDPSTYDRPTGAADPGMVYVDFSAVASVTVAALGI
jgi:hypothetical protein